MFLKHYLIAFPIMLVLDFIWLKFVAKSFYFSRMGHLLSEKLSYPPAIAFYTLYAGGIVFFCINPAMEVASVKKALYLGALFGFFCYMTYDLTNQSTLKNWPIAVSIVDIIWGAAVSSVTSGLATFILLKMRG